MLSDMPRLFLARHGDTAWTDSRQRTGRTDLPLNERGLERARQIGERLQRFSFARVFTSPLQRASKTCELAGFGAVAEVDFSRGKKSLIRPQKLSAPYCLLKSILGEMGG
jgi:bisphosphoglycerate-dependent phosphoglycerate mutase